MTEKDLNKNLIKSNATFGGVKVFQMLVTLLRAKIVAVILGPTGMGIQVLFNSTLSSLHQFTSFGIFQSSVRDIAQTTNKSEKEQKGIVNVVFTMSMLIGIFGCLFCVVFSGLLSKLVFGNFDYKVAFIIIAFAVLCEALSQGQVAVFQGLHKLSELAKGTLFGAIISLLICIPLYYIWGIAAIPYAIVVGYGVVFVVYRLYARKIPVMNHIAFSKLSDLKKQGVPVATLGVILMLSNGLMTLFTLALNTFVNRTGGAADVGLYNAAVQCTYGNIIVFTSILASDYYPRLSSSLDDKKQFEAIVNNQMELLLLVVAPLICAVILFAKLVVRILLSSEFISIAPMIQLMAIALIFRIIWHSLSFVILAKGDKKTYFIFDAVLGNGSVFLFNILGYYLWGLQGLAISYVVGSVLMFCMLCVLIPKKYNIRIRNGFWKLFIYGCTACVTALLVSRLVTGVVGMILNILVIVVSASYSLYILNGKIGFYKKANRS